MSLYLPKYIDLKPDSTDISNDVHIYCIYTQTYLILNLMTG